MSNSPIDRRMDSELDERIQHLERVIGQMNENGEPDAWITEQEAPEEFPEIDDELDSAVAAMELDSCIAELEAGQEEPEMDEDMVTAIAAMEAKQQEMDERLKKAINKAASEHWPDDDGKLEDAIIHAASQKTAKKDIFDS